MLGGWYFTDYGADISVGDYEELSDYGFLYKISLLVGINISGAIPTIAQAKVVLESTTIRELLQTGKITLQATSPDTRA